ncbi:muts domain V-domain-containing protein [Protomyces lactucae-debilis]|uniref:DNA mismatch repair protein MSH6 n=1 Tax=Protomyces lactucae-debilis TaxID=2754530 RepID=A0A1Y2FV21_PROLT|nr:muts domain V-domain-containing protein [Protomyces lactucae-debilis]ORY87848.1 muts domain V-domain-containing protein [Protomyces lactucae-debilis]
MPLSRQEELVQTVRPWLRPENIRDADRRKPDDPLYNPRTLYIPPSALAEFGNFEAQFWSFKKENWDAVIFFQKGKFYELYEDDAVLGHQLFDLKLTSRGMRMVGVPDYTFDDWAAQFVAKGYRVARVDQMESILGKDIREKEGAKKDKIVRRELTQVLTQGTLVDPNMLTGDHNTYILSLKEMECDTDGAVPKFGVCFADAATGQCYFSSFKDDLARTQLDTLLSQVKPRELVLEKGKLSPASTKCINNAVSPQTQFNWIKDVDFWEADRVRLELKEARYFESDEQDWHPVLQRCLADEACGNALGGLLWYLRNLKLDHDLLSLANFEDYHPLQRAASLVLDGGTLVNLEVFSNTWDGGSAGTLFGLICRCRSPMGKRLLKRWVCHPLRDIDALNARFNAVDLLMQDHALATSLETQLQALPDLERQLARLHVGRCKVAEFVKVLGGFSALAKLLQELAATLEGKDVLMESILQQAPDMTDRLKYWRSAFNWEAAVSNDPKRPGIIVPSPGTEEDFDASQEALEGLLSQFDPLLRQYQRDLKSSKIAYRDVGNSKDIYQIEVPVSVKVPSDWQQMSATKQVKRYWSPEIAVLVRQLLEQQERHKAIVESLQQRLYKRFDADFSSWHALVVCGAQLDCLLSLASSSKTLGAPACRPTFLADDTSILDLKSVRHPCADATTFIPNDILLGGTDGARMSLLTGPNMAGKSTLLRSACTAVLLAQLGHYVPASSCALTPLDQISVRTGGARDNIGGGQSTFMVELAETATLLSSATPRSLVVLDELGRGTGTFDGMAVAFAVLQHLLTRIGCLGFFSTHYALLAQEFEKHPGCKFENMSFLLDEGGDAGQGKVTFLYKLVAGICSHSHGLNVARMAGLPEELITVAAEASKRFEAQHGTSLQSRQQPEIPLGLESDLITLFAAVQGNAEEVTEDVLLRIADYAGSVFA